MHKAVLLIDNAPGHACAEELINPHIKVIYLRPNTTLFIQPMDQGLIAIYKSYYFNKTFSQAISATNGESIESRDLCQFWKNYNIRDTVQNIGEAWKEVKPETLTSAWRKIYEEGVVGLESRETEESINNINSIELGKVIYALT